LSSLFEVGDKVRLKALRPKTRAVVVRVFKDRTSHMHNNWDGWVEIEPKISGFSRWHESELEKVNVK
jgi:hypothetical protein